MLILSLKILEKFKKSKEVLSDKKITIKKG